MKCGLNVIIFFVVFVNVLLLIEIGGVMLLVCF